MYRSTLFATGLLVLAFPAAGAACLSGPFGVTLPAQPLAERLAELEQITGCEVDAAPALVTGIDAPALAGDLRADEAFFASVAGSGLEAGPTQGRWRISRDMQERYAERFGALREAADARRDTGALDEAEASRLDAELDRLAAEIGSLVREKGFLSAAETASFNRTLDEMEAQLRA